MTRLRIPAPLDPHVHLRGMEWAHKGTFASETAAALAGGYWAVVDMPNTPPATLTPAALAVKRAELAAEAACDWGVWFGAGSSVGTAAYASVSRGVAGLKMYCDETTGMLLIEENDARAQRLAAWPGPGPVAVHAEEDSLAEVLDLLRRNPVRLHVCHVSTAREVELIAAAKAEGLPVTAGVTPHHLFLSEDDLPALGPFGRMKPELKSAADRDAMWRGIESRVIDIVESDHAPHTLAEKEADRPAFGVPGLETTLPLLASAVHEGRLEPERLVELVAEAPRALLGLQAPAETWTELEIGSPREIQGAQLHSACGWTPFEGQTVYGRVVEVRIRGRTVYDGEKVLAAPGSGCGLFPQGSA